MGSVALSHQHKGQLAKYPAPVLNEHCWSWWRKWLKLPPESVLARCKEWDQLIELMEQPHQPARISTGQSKIFWDSLTCWDFMDRYGESAFSFHSWNHFVSRKSDRRFVSPFGPLVLETEVDAFQCDARSIQGMASSKSSSRPHESIDEFGACFLAELNQENTRRNEPLLSFDEPSLQELCKHHEIRILNSVGSDHFSIRAWDGRLFLNNDGGSHHLAAAIHVASRINKPLPVSEKLNLYRLNPPTVKWIQDGFHAILLPRDLATKVRNIVARLLDGASIMEMPGCLSDGAIVAFQKNSELANIMAHMLLKRGFLEFGAILTAAFERQEKFLEGAPFAF